MKKNFEYVQKPYKKVIRITKDEKRLLITLLASLQKNILIGEKEIMTTVTNMCTINLTKFISDEFLKSRSYHITMDRKEEQALRQLVAFAAHKKIHIKGNPWKEEEIPHFKSIVRKIEDPTTDIVLFENEARRIKEIIITLYNDPNFLEKNKKKELQRETILRLEENIPKLKDLFREITGISVRRYFEIAEIFDDEK